MTLSYVIFLLRHADRNISRVAYKKLYRSFIQTHNFHLSSTNQVMPSKLQIIPRPSKERGHADHGWLKSFHTWSFASYNDPRFPNGFGCLRVLNEDRVQPTTGFGTHGHSEYEIFSYIVDGELQHKDSMGNTEILHRGEVQFTSAGTGIQHSEYNIHQSLWVHFIQIWVKPNQSHLKPSYTTKKWSDEEKLNKLCLLVDDIQSSNDRTIAIHASLSMYASILQPNHSIKHVFKRTKGYIHLIMRSGYEATNGAKIRIGGEVILQEGDGAFINSEQPNGEISIENVGGVNAEFLLFYLE
jgi:redox-sensitive bicupin YhaK (pirin superfamily)